MKLKSTFIILFAFILLSCNTNKKVSEEKTKDQNFDMHNSMNSLDWQATYIGTLPCTACDGVKTILKLNYDLTYIKNTNHLGEKDSITEDKGSFTWDNTGQIITLNTNKNEQYFIGESSIWKLDIDGNKITGEEAQNYILKKQRTQLTDRHWKLVELNGKKVDYEKKKANQPYLILKPEEDNKVYGKTGCNRFFGTFELKEGSQISFSKMGATKRYCQNMETEKQFLEVLSKADNYSLNGETLTLNKAKKTPLAKFEVAYFN